MTKEQKLTTYFTDFGYLFFRLNNSRGLDLNISASCGR